MLNHVNKYTQRIKRSENEEVENTKSLVILINTAKSVKMESVCNGSVT